MSQKSENNLILKVNVSRALVWILTFIHIGAMLVLALAPLMWPLRIVVLALLVWSLRRTINLYALRRVPGAVEEIEIDGEREISVRFTGYATWSRCQLRSKFVHPWIMLLSLQTEGRNWPVRVVIAADAVDTEAFRRWRVALKLHTAAA
ncbi:MAG TPA: protein YgfX [Candidatus Methylomirabilis sp.]|nr:protein YgfX [Candidatus Methylomirabilis sp.]